MLGMIALGNTSISSYDSRTVTIEVTGVCRQAVMRTSNYTLKVPYSRMSSAIQNINRLGGKVTGIYLAGSDTVFTEKPPKNQRKDVSS
ncbi:MAG: phycobilisome linker polypeptide [Cyanobacteria bacterium J06621_8]